MLSATDPTGRLIVLSQQTWDEHIIRYHSDVVPDWIVMAVEEPDIITRDTLNSTSRRPVLCYYKCNVLPAAYGHDLMKVIATKRRRGQVFDVDSAYPAHHVKLSQEEVIWTPITPSTSD